MDNRAIYETLTTLLTELQDNAKLSAGDLFVVGCSTSEVMGEHIGTTGSEDVARDLFAALREFAEETGVALAFQCCEHLNRALIVEKQTAKENKLEQVTVIPTGKAGGAMATYAYRQMREPVAVEHIKADAGIDIGDTFIGMHLKHVAVPVRGSMRLVGGANVTMAKTRPKLIGGERAVYRDDTDQDCISS
nr:TIGR01440 family protein [Lottiidibacillus patelloidae]